MAIRALLLFTCFFAADINAQRLPADARVEALLSKMTLEEKLGQLSQYVPDQPEWVPALEKGLAGAMLNSGGASQVNELQRRALAGSRLRIPLLVGHDVIHGYRTIFPIPLAMASSWSPELAMLSARIAAREARAAGIRWTFAPMVDVARDPRWGRIAEGAGEDPFLGSAMASAYVHGFQGDGPNAPDSLLACAKHFAAYGAAEGGRDYNTTDMSEGRLRETYLPPFRAAVEAGVATLMSAFNSLNGVPSTANRHLLREILRGEWKFRGFVVSDWAAVTQLIDHGLAATPADAAFLAISAGVDMDMWDHAYGDLAPALRAGRLRSSVVDDSVRRILRAKFDAGLFENPFTDETRMAAAMLTAENRAAARRIAQRSIVLLKNEGDLLPLSRSPRTIAVIGPLAGSKRDMLGPWAAQGKAEETVSVIEGLRTATAGSEVRIVQTAGSGILDGGDDAIAEAVETAKQSDLVIAVLGESADMSGEAASRASLDLPGRQQELLEAVAGAGKPVILVLMAGRPLAIPWAAEHVSAILYTWFLGSEGGNAIADVLLGVINPSGRLPVTIPRATGQVPIAYDHLPTGRPANREDKFTSKYLDVPIGPLYPFGFGLSYTKFEYGGWAVSTPAVRPDGRIVVSAEVHNTGPRAGDEVAQLYLSRPVSKVSQPVRRLKGFTRIALAPGERKRVEFVLTSRELESWTDEGWRVEAGEFRVWIGHDSTAGLSGTFRVDQASKR